MEIHLFMMVWFTALAFTILSYYAKNNWVFPLFAGVGWIATAMSLSEISFVLQSGGQYHINMGDPHTVGMLGTYWYYWGIGIVLILMTAGWVISGKKVGSDI